MPTITRTRPACTEHLSCRLGHYTPADVDVVETVMGPTGHVFFSLMVRGEFIGSVSDRGMRAHDGRWISHWEGFAGGAAVPTGPDPRDAEGNWMPQTRDHVVACVIAYCISAGGHVRRALHPGRF